VAQRMGVLNLPITRQAVRDPGPSRLLTTLTDADRVLISTTFCGIIVA
jgi:hypothetical protein